MNGQIPKLDTFCKYNNINMLDLDYLLSEIQPEEYNTDEIEACFNTMDNDGSVHEYIDGLIGIYYYDLRQWAVDNWEWVEEAINEGLCEGESDYHRLIQASCTHDPIHPQDTQTTP